MRRVELIAPKWADSHPDYCEGRRDSDLRASFCISFALTLFLRDKVGLSLLQSDELNSSRMKYTDDYSSLEKKRLKSWNKFWKVAGLRIRNMQLKYNIWENCVQFKFNLLKNPVRVTVIEAHLLNPWISKNSLKKHSGMLQALNNAAYGTHMRTFWHLLFVRRKKNYLEWRHIGEKPPFLQP